MSIDFEKPLPPLKNTVEAVQIQHEGKPMILLRDLEAINPKEVALPLPSFMIALMCNGRTPVSEITQQLSKQTGVVFKQSDIETIINQLDDHYLLETPRLQAKRQEVLDAFVKSDVRKAHHVGGGYPAEKMELATFLGKFFKDSKGPGKEMGTATNGKHIQGLLSPHIDFHRGGPAYAWAYQALSESAIPDIILGLGVAHMSPNSPWVLTKKSYETPYGPMEWDQKLYQDFDQILWYEGSEDQWAHRTEHSLEFQALWLKYLWKEKTPAWLPVLCSSFDRFCPDKPPSTISSINDAIEAMGKKLLEYQNQGKKILILGGVDLAHVGPRFGDKEDVSAEMKERVKKEDALSLEKALHVDADEFYMSVVKDGHPRKVCGLSAIYTALRLLKILNSTGSNLKGRQLVYDQAEDPMGGIVSFTSMVFESLN